ncbi:unnamed protein product, partial [marine sediment metagenome]
IVSLAIGESAEEGEQETITACMSWKDRLVSPDGDLVDAFAAINDKTIPDVKHNRRYVLSEFIMDGLNYEAFFTEVVESGEAHYALMQGADNSPIDYLVATLKGVGAAETTRTLESGRTVLSGFHLKVSNRKGTKYNPCTVRFKTRGNIT